MSARRQRLFGRAAALGLLALAAATPAYAQAAGGDIGGFIQQLIDLNTRELPSTDRHSIPVLVLLDEFARLGHAPAIARGFSYVAGYGLRLLPVLQSPAQLRAEYGPDTTEEIMANCGVEVAFAPKELKAAQELSERLGYWTYLGRSESKPTLLSSGRRTTTESHQRRALMLPQELTAMPSDQLIVLRAGMPPVRGRKIIYWREKAFTARVTAPPTIAPRPLAAQTAAEAIPAEASVDAPLHDIAPALAAASLQPLPGEGASDDEVQAWIDRYIDDAAGPLARELDHA